MNKKWYLVYCKPRQDIRAECNLARQGFEVYRPTIQVSKSKIGQKRTSKVESLFPGYVFIHADPQATSLAPVMSTFGVAGFVKFGQTYATASNELIIQIKASFAEYTSSISADAFTHGDKVRLNSPGFEHVKAIYCNPCGKDRALILLNILGNESKMIVAQKCISVA
ncbi:transcription/translation regulatory transformer protein RfaH [Teredinibacter sp. KSP-S5-2]|uniref:transcription/translation regulatory transformer protein RfaH n=1 Tax=Teredinibacter sp. KSP-S5-2 TaxID=3034506 RepID=UPI002934F6CF|nr:transcription/translation regulatory transformer protein RfaH [Teredinibacter sp. KSP-S5-2]WNO11568.1 transcription/translation regulatory transformer protein RfaH [Teredinibacter sp. KSP-S5-2]